MHAKDKKQWDKNDNPYGRWEIHYDNEDENNYGELFYIEHWLNGVRVGYEENIWDFKPIEKIYNAR
jgi:hypothetical protein